MGCASTVAAAMLNLWAEVENGVLENPITRARFEFSRKSQSLWPQLIFYLSEKSGVHIHHGYGTHVINNSDSSGQCANFRSIVNTLKEYNEPYSDISPENFTKKIAYHQPSPGRHVRAAIEIPSEGWVNPNHLIQAIEKIISNHQSAQFIDKQCARIDVLNDNAYGITFENGETLNLDKIIVCNGASFSKLMKASNMLNRFQRVFYGVGGSIVFKSSGNTKLEHCVRTPSRGLACGLYAMPYDSKNIIVGTTNYVSQNSKNLRLHNIYLLIKQIQEELNIHCWKSTHVRTNMGWRPISTDTLPMIGATSVKNMFVVTGTYRDGLFCSPIISNWISDLVLEGGSSLDEPLFAPERKLVAVYSREEAVKRYVEHQMNDPRTNDGSQNQAMLESSFKEEYERLHDKIRATDWGIPLLVHHMYETGYLKPGIAHYTPVKYQSLMSGVRN